MSGVRAGAAGLACCVPLLGACAHPKGDDSGSFDSRPPCEAVGSTAASKAELTSAGSAASLAVNAVGAFARIDDVDGDGIDELAVSRGPDPDVALGQIDVFFGPVSGDLDSPAVLRSTYLPDGEIEYVGSEVWSGLSLGVEGAPLFASFAYLPPSPLYSPQRGSLLLFDASAASPGSPLVPFGDLDTTPADEPAPDLGFGGLVAVTDFTGEGVGGVFLASVGETARVDYVQGPLTGFTAVSDATAVVVLDPRRNIGYRFGSRAAGDFNGDGYTDVFAFSDDFGLEVVAGGPDPVAAFASPYATLETGCGSLGDSSRDLSGDGLPDLVVGCSQEARYEDPDDDWAGSGAVYVFANLGPGVHELDEALFAVTGSADLHSFGSEWTEDDLNQDGQADLIVSAPGRIEDDTFRDEHVDALVTVFLDPSPPACGSLSLDDATGGIHQERSLGNTWATSLTTMDNDGDGVRDIVVGGQDGLAVYSGAATLGR